MEYVIYGDLLFLINFLLDFSLIFATSKFSSCYLKIYRCIFAALAGGIYGVLVLVPKFSMFYTLILQLAFPFLMLFIAFGKMNFLKFLRLVAYFYLIALTMAGAVIGGGSILRENNIFLDFSTPLNVLTLIFPLVVAFILGSYGINNFKRVQQNNALEASAKVVLNKHFKEVNVFFDTGNDLIEPISKHSVMVLEYRAVKDILPLKFCLYYEKYGNDSVKLLEKLREEEFFSRLRLVPFNALGKDNGMLVAFRPDFVVFSKLNSLRKDRENENNKNIIVENILVALYNGKIQNSYGYSGLVNPIVLVEEGGREIWQKGA